MRFTLFLLCFFMGSTAWANPGLPVDFARDIQPLLKNRCVECHGSTKQRGGLRLDTGKNLLKGASSGEVILPGKAHQSRLIEVVAGRGDLQMPPKGPKLTDAEIALLRRWIDQGARVPEETANQPSESDHWAFRKPLRPSLPAIKNTDWVRNPIDHFILARLEKENLKPSPEADRATLLRRVHLDLTGLPPSPRQVDAFLKDSRPDAYERIVEGLLASPHYGERWARHWLDLARYADSNGFNIDAPRSIWPYRDWVIRALNRDLPFDRFVIEQLAGDLLPGATLEQKIATGFHRNTLLNQEGGIDLEQFRNESIIDRVNTTGTVFLGLTLGCAQCHEHKFDPISQEEYFQIFAFFNNCEEPVLALPTHAETQALEKLKLQEDRLLKKIQGFDRVTNERFQHWDKNLTSAEKVKYPTKIKDVLDKPDYQRTRDEKQLVRSIYRGLDQLPQIISPLAGTLGGWGDRFGSLGNLHAALFRAGVEGQLQALKEQEPVVATTMVLEERAEPRESYIHIRGDFLRKGKKVKPGTFEALHPFQPPAQKKQPDRLDFARWLVDENNPLTARVVVNRFWQQFFGLGIVETENDFGTQGTPPTHPELLDWLATEFPRQNWSMKAMHRLMATSATYRQASKARPEIVQVDPRNRLLARQNRLRLEAEVVRDAALTVSGLLNPTLGGPSVFPPQPNGVFAFTQIPRDWKDDTGSNRFRRGMYTHFWRSAPHPALMAFDAPDSTSTCTRRNRSNTPLQALTLLNDRAFFEFAHALANRIIKESPGPLERKIHYAFRLCLGRDPSTAEAERVAGWWKNLQKELASAPEEANRLFSGNLPANSSRPEAAAWVQLSRAFLNLDEFISRE